jgi:hypothetical protein
VTASAGTGCLGRLALAAFKKPDEARNEENEDHHVPEELEEFIDHAEEPAD